MQVESNRTRWWYNFENKFFWGSVKIHKILVKFCILESKFPYGILYTVLHTITKDFYISVSYQCLANQTKGVIWYETIKNGKQIFNTNSYTFKISCHEYTQVLIISMHNSLPWYYFLIFYFNQIFVIHMSQRLTDGT